MFAALFTAAVLGARTSLLEQGSAANMAYWRSINVNQLKQLLEVCPACLTPMPEAPPLTIACVCDRVVWQRDVALEARDIDGCTALIWASRETSDPRVVEMLLEAGADANEKAKNGWTPLHWAATFNKGESGKGIVRALLKHGADPTITATGMTPLEWARRNGNPDVEQALDPATAAAMEAAKQLTAAASGPASAIHTDKLRIAVVGATKAGVSEATLQSARQLLRLVSAMDSDLLRLLEQLGQPELAPVLLEHDILHLETLAHIEVQLLMSSLNLSLGKAARLHREATLKVMPATPARSIPVRQQQQRVEL